jgi:hypothetical protein
MKPAELIDSLSHKTNYKKMRNKSLFSGYFSLTSKKTFLKQTLLPMKYMAINRNGGKNILLSHD